jgi:hypothetical protein
MLKKIVISFSHAVLLIVLHLIYFNLNWSLPLEFEMMMMMNKVEIFVGGRGDFDEKKYFFINTAYDPVLTETENEYGEVGKIVVTDREKLGKFFEKMAEHGNRHQYILCDILFDLNTNQDSLFAKSIAKVKKIIVPAEYNKEEKRLVPPLFNVNYAQADYITYEGIVSKIRIYDSESKSKTLPLKMFEECNNLTIKKNLLGLYYNGNYIARTIYPRYFYDRVKMQKNEMSLGSLVNLMEGNDTLFYKDVLQGKILIIGNFTNETHSTFIGPLPGSLILFNTYLTLEAGYHLISLGWFVFALLSFATLCYLEFFNKKKPGISERITWKTHLKNLLGATFWCLVISFLSGLIFKIHITIIPLIIYLELFRHIGKLKLFSKHKT